MVLSLTPAPTIFDFEPFHLDFRAGQLRRDTTAVPLRPKTFAVLQYLVQHPGELVTKQALLGAIWRDVLVSEDVVRISIGELREVLGDERAAPLFIETVPRRGYRFIAKMSAATTHTPIAAVEPTSDAESAADGVVVGRAQERTELAEWLHAATGGRRQIGFITGEAGIGKTTLVDTVLRDLQRTYGAHLRIARGQCVEHYGGGEPYLPVLEALTSLRRGSGASAVEASLRDTAPEWLLRVMGLLAPRAGDRTELVAGTHEHTLHRLAASLEALAAATPLVLVLEDVQWSDYSTLDLLSVVAQRRESAQLLVLCTLRQADAIVQGHPVASVKRELRRKGLCREILLGGLSAADIAGYVAARLPAADLPAHLLRLLVDRSEGSPFVVVALVDHLLDQQLLVESGNRWELRGDLETLRTVIPDGLRAVIEPRLERLAPDELRVLEAASVAGLEFAAHVVARVGPDGSNLADVEYVEHLCGGLVRRQEILRAKGESAWPNGTTSARFAFRHALYQQVIYQRLSTSTRRRLHQKIGEALEAVHDGRTAEIASTLAAHFERSGDIDRAVGFHREAAAHAGARFAYQEASLHLQTALGLLRSQPEVAPRLRREMPLLDDLGSAFFAIKGYGDEGAACAFARMREIAESLDDSPMRLRAMGGLLLARTMTAELTAARALGEETIALAEQLGNQLAAANARLTLGLTLFSLGELGAAHRHAEDVRALLASNSSAVAAAFGIPTCCLLASTCAHLGLVAQARAMSREALARAPALGIPYLRTQATNLTAQVCALLRDVTGARSLAEQSLRLASEYGFSVFGIAATTVRGWCDVEEARGGDGISSLRVAVDEYAATGQRISTTFFSMLLAEAYLASGEVAAANTVIDTALAFAVKTGQRVYEHELYRLKGQCLLVGATTRGQRAEALASFERALGVATQRKARLFELRAATSLCRVRKSAREHLVRLVDRFAAEDDCPDLHAARAALVGDRS